MLHEENTESFIYKYIAKVIENSNLLNNDELQACFKDALYFASHVLDDSFIVPDIKIHDDGITFKWEASNESTIKIKFIGNTNINFVALSDLEKPIPHSMYSDIDIETLFDVIPAAWSHLGYVWRKPNYRDYSKYADKQVLYYPELRLMYQHDLSPMEGIGS